MTTPATGDQNADQLMEAKVEALQAVLDRVLSWREGATEGTVREELDSALDEAGIDLGEPARERMVEHIHEGNEHVDVRTFLD
ncbi:hypothetical protein [Knoellia sp. LjRoot47]|uniref:hypothetical protein n=1 Tax=Knoellia sp. LjRoot47 TaxID=3342330 RepID=UPI003ED09B77